MIRIEVWILDFFGIFQNRKIVFFRRFVLSDQSSSSEENVMATGGQQLSRRVEGELLEQGDKFA